jgi:hypothetical protein
MGVCPISSSCRKRCCRRRNTDCLALVEKKKDDTICDDTDACDDNFYDTVNIGLDGAESTEACRQDNQSTRIIPHEELKAMSAIEKDQLSEVGQRAVRFMEEAAENGTLETLLLELKDRENSASADFGKTCAWAKRRIENAGMSGVLVLSLCQIGGHEPPKAKKAKARMASKEKKSREDQSTVKDSEVEVSKWFGDLKQRCDAMDMMELPLRRPAPAPRSISATPKCPTAA